MNEVFLSGSLLVVALLSPCSGYKHFQQRIPNGEMVPHPCKANFLWRGVGHENVNGGGKRNAFGLDFKANGLVWNADICMKDSDGDGRTNGEELGDPDCTWTPGTAPKYSAGLSHPGVCEPIDKPECAGKTDFVGCGSEQFICPAMNETDTFQHKVRFPQTDVPPKETTYMCMLFEFPNQEDFHIVATTPHIDNEDVMHHIIVYGCDPEGTVSNPLNQPYPSNMRCDEVCSEVIGLWSVGGNGHCMNSDVGFKVGATGFRIGAIEMHWNNPLYRNDYTDSSGMTFYLTPNLRTYEAGVLMIGQSYLEIPPGQVAYSTEGGCPGTCTSTLMDGPLYITEAFNHMHYLGSAQRTRLIKNNVSVDLAWDREYSYDSPTMYRNEVPIRMDPGDDLVTTCTYRSTSRTVTTYFGESTSAEMCFAFIMYYPKQNFRLPTCASYLSISQCDFYSGVIQGCDMQKMMDPTHPEMQAFYGQLWTNCALGKCTPECLEFVREAKKHPCYSGDVSKLFRSRLGDRYESSQDASEVILYARLDSCDAELAREQCPVCREDNGLVGTAVPLKASLSVTTTVLLLLGNHFIRF